MIVTQSQLIAEHQRYLYYSREAGSVPIEKRGEDRTLSPQAAKQWGAQVLATYARDRGQNVSSDQINDVAGAFGNQGGKDWARLNPDQKQLSAVLTNSATAAMADELGVDAALAEVAIETLRDGEITAEEVHSMCSTAGSIAGAVVGQAFGIPAPIGAFVGGIIGGVVGGVVASIAGLDSGPDYARIALAQARAEAKQWNDWQRGVRMTCSDNATAYQNRLDFTVRELSQKLEAIERDLGGLQLDLVWAGKIAPEDTSYYSALQGVRGATRETWSQTRCSDVSGARRCTDFPRENYVCELPDGCLIPPIGGQGVAKRSEREIINALMFYGAQWRAENQRWNWYCHTWPTLNVEALALQNRTAGGKRNCNVYGTGFPPPGVIAPVACDFYKDTMRESVKPGDAMEALVPARILTKQAIVKTASIAKSNIHIAERRHALATAGADVKRSAWAVGKRRSWWANNGTLVLGAGLLGYALWQAKKERRL